MVVPKRHLRNAASAATQLTWMQARLRPCDVVPRHREGLQILFKCRFWLNVYVVGQRLCI